MTRSDPSRTWTLVLCASTVAIAATATTATFLVSSACLALLATGLRREADAAPSHRQAISDVPFTRLRDGRLELPRPLEIDWEARPSFSERTGSALVNELEAFGRTGFTIGLAALGRLREEDQRQERPCEERTANAILKAHAEAVATSGRAIPTARIAWLKELDPGFWHAFLKVGRPSTHSIHPDGLPHYLRYLADGDAGRLAELRDIFERDAAERHVVAAT